MDISDHRPAGRSASHGAFPVEFGLFNLMSYRSHPGGVAGILDDTRNMVRLAEEVGLDIAWFAEHHFTNYSISVSPLLMMAHMASATTRIRLGSAVIVLPLYQPMRVAQEIALVDQLSGGRVVLGVGSGYQPFEFARYGVDVETRGDVFLKYWDVLEEALTTGTVTQAAQALGLPDTPVLLRPVQKPLPPLFITSANPTVLRRFAPLGATPFVTAGWRGSDALVGLARQMRRSWSEAGLDPRPMPIGLQQYIHVTDSRDEAMAAADCARFVGRMATGLRSPDITSTGAMIDVPPLPDEPPLDTFRSNLLIGPPDEVAERMIGEIRATGCTHYSTFFQFGDMPFAMARRSLERFGAEVLPIVKREIAAHAAGEPAPRGVSGAALH
ncbi:alkanesulfonate monooxygenase SsuD/methylene tetrahydromethanopterin reductase-like flavin-dependent oxidoreductase (luciferase family) [Ancylobacter sp. 3268]|uniref:LLM class flavin-dependent oxidoreductase n=1 Tax=Ancylobacter sp. 3268 TaxID=2817752 RepID=UPI002865B2D0|nr:LLM class flavin-dependent oxidoreductase [Ancylobacter sp. 3268]MDR6954789.1 alkanesulfonate monooxygenase SsuD/methylene tetrahydromethanopterin reductase-like flavin-dependent oxidoreductase (luciferase family) [Ancylobacter sp. 3268]